MDRRRFIALCGTAVAAIAAKPAALARQPNAAFKPYRRAKLVDPNGQPIHARELEKGAGYIFHYPFAGTPCFLINLNQAAAADVALNTADGGAYRWRGGVGPQQSLVAFSAICSHQLSYVGKQQSFINYRPDSSPVAGRGGVIVCCAHHSVFDPAQGAKVLDGPAPQPLAAIALEHNADTDELYALGTYGGELFEDFFTAYKKDLIEEFGRGVAHEEIEGKTAVRPITEYTRNQVFC